MTPQDNNVRQTAAERAEKIFLMRAMFVNDPVGQKNFIFKIAAQIEEAEREAIAKHFSHAMFYSDAFNDGWNAAREKAKGIADKYVIDPDKDDGGYIAEKISIAIAKMDNA